MKKRFCKEDDLLPGRPALSELNGTAYGTTMQPSIRVDAESLALKFLQLGWFVDRFEQWEKAFGVELLVQGIDESN